MAYAPTSRACQAPVPSTGRTRFAGRSRSCLHCADRRRLALVPGGGQPGLGPGPVHREDRGRHSDIERRRRTVPCVLAEAQDRVLAVYSRSTGGILGVPQQVRMGKFG